MEFNTNEILLEMQQLDFPPNAKKALERLRQNIYYCAPEVLGDRFFNGQSNTMGICEILTKYTTDDIAKEVDQKYADIVDKYTKWKNSRAEN